MAIFHLPQEAKLVEAMAPAADAAGRTSDYVSLKNYAMCYIVIHITQGNAATVALTPLQATAVAGTGAKAIPATQIWANLDTAASDTLSRVGTDAVSYTTDAAVKNKIVVFQIDPRQLDAQNNFDCIAFTTGGSNAANITQAMFVLTNARFSGNTLPSAIID